MRSRVTSVLTAEYAGLESSLLIPALNYEIPLAFIYGKVLFEPDDTA